MQKQEYLDHLSLMLLFNCSEQFGVLCSIVSQQYTFSVPENFAHYLAS